MKKSNVNQHIAGVIILMTTLLGCTDSTDVQPLTEPMAKLAVNDPVPITNPGFESSWSGWNDTDPSSISGVANSGSKSAKITGSGGRFEQSVSVSSNTDYELTAYVRDEGTIGVTAGGTTYSDGGNFSSWTKVTVNFNSGSNSSVTIFGAYNGGTGRFDDFAMIETGSGGGGSGGGSGSGQLSVASVSASAHDGNVPENTLDGSLSTRWSANGSGQYITFDLGSSQDVSSLKVAWYKGDQRSASFKIRLGNTTSSLSDVYVGNSSGSTLNLETYDFTTTNARYVRITGFGNSQNTWNSITEVEIYGTDGGSGGGDGGSGGGDGGSGGGGGSASVPSDLMDNCNQWKITYPDGTEDKTLCNEPNNEYFFVNGTGDGIVFKAPIRSNNGTTPNSSYVRSELRERKPDGSSDVYWTTSGTHVVYVKQAITHLPMNKNHLVATQIHGNKSEGIDDAMVLRLEGSHLFLSFNGGQLRSDHTIKTNYSLGTTHEVIFEVINGKHYCYYSEDGNLKNAYANGSASSYLVKDGSNNHVMDRSYGDAYFKVGNYTQSNADREGSDTDNPNNYGEVVVYDFYVSHN
ncbi:polysaccharide lyase family 7 protein [Marinoscillum furvescens]|uniref:F5/8 type C domain-containing protein n=1 Tax=Marinoscillum furvescens DSM 4134 TaxID=1122208 RepID=A0A3D9L3E1_MARFU|nr:polysaccharide lyase family 7 protein [Marinoscillum furvescens]RED96601.1 F5/8 type C domain-containing protein [Marinoscillum furvescens DSM 4134]